MSAKRYALIDTQELVIIQTKVFDAPENVPLLQPAKVARWVPVIRINDVPWDETTHKKEPIPISDVTLTEVTWTFIIREWNEDELTALYLQRIEEVNRECERRILVIMPEHTQRNNMARGLSNVIEYGLNVTEDWPLEEQAKLSEVLGKWGQINSLRTTCAALIAAIPEDSVGLSAYDASVGWD